jgi:CheY-like chemotaxis protein
MTKMLRILLVEDDSINAFVFKKFLEDKFLIDHAKNGTLALSMYEEGKYDLVLMDINLGEENFTGIDVMKALRKLNDKLSIIALTAYASTGDRMSFLKQGFTEYIAKPVNRNLLIEKIQQFI